jgi:hypothetical protein
MAENHQNISSNGLPNPLTDQHQNTFKDSFPNNRSIDPSNPLFLNSGENPALILVGSPLTGENYNTWSRSMLVSLSAKNKIGLLDGSICKPSKHDDFFLAWTRCNDMVVSWILHVVSSDIKSSIIYITSSKIMWEDLKDRYSQRNGPRIFQLQKSIVATFQENSNVSQYFTQLKTLWEELNNYRPMSICNCCNCGRVKSILELHSQEQVDQFLVGLNDSFSAVRAQILLTDHLPPLNKVFSLIIQEEKQKEITVNSMSHESIAFLTKSVLNPSSSQMNEPTALMTKSILGSRFAKSNFRKPVLIVVFLAIQLRNAIRYIDFHLDSSLPKLNHQINTHHPNIQLIKFNHPTNTHHLNIQPTKFSHNINIYHLITQSTKFRLNNPIFIISTILIQ